jgi:hypothetical protein
MRSPEAASCGFQVFESAVVSTGAACWQIDRMSASVRREKKNNLAMVNPAQISQIRGTKNLIACKSAI